MDPSPHLSQGIAPLPVPSPLTSAITPMSAALTSDSHLLDEFESRNENIRSLLFDPAATTSAEEMVSHPSPHFIPHPNQHQPSIVDYQHQTIGAVDPSLSSSTTLPSIQAIVADTSSLPASYASASAVAAPAAEEDSDLTDEEEEFETEGAGGTANQVAASNCSAMRVDTSISEQLPELSRIIDTLSPSAIIRYSTPPISATPSLQSSPSATLSSSAAMPHQAPMVPRLTMSRYPSGSNQVATGGGGGTPLALPSPFRSQSGSRRSSYAPPLHTLSPPPQVITPNDENGATQNRTPLSNTHVRTAMVHMQAQMQAYVDQCVAQIQTQLNEYVKQHLHQLEQQLNSNDPTTAANALSALSMPLPRLDATTLSSSPPFCAPSAVSNASRKLFNLDTHSNGAIAPFLSPLHSAPQRFPSPFVRQPTPSSANNHSTSGSSNGKPETPHRTVSGTSALAHVKVGASPLRPTLAILQANVSGSPPTAPEASPNHPSL